ncbi:prolyl oligopeptidase family serine peptidase [Streptomyces sp. N50]|uniref:prolyl oligopeptidase family serine peptidase n=1 Tax=Streptomyces sp. N50 TaxID=3081765 RepID=UPI002961FBDA|nr:prolyl oligopeptidase family serine peptidase [Streptomyces sp. N50]WOX12723.1 prolyl oligopeptidase family serine peptidase [Streptomyces sp. N50]
MTAGQIAAPSYLGFQGEELWWIEPRPQEDGRSALMRGRRPDADAETVLPGPWNIRSRVIEYGGRPWATAADDLGVLVVFVNFPDQRLYLYRPDTEGAGPQPLTPVSPVGGGLRWAEPEVDLARGAVRCVLEEFTGEGPSDVRRLIAQVPLDGSAAEDRGAVRELSDDRHRFVSGARVSPDGSRAVWLAWDHPHMPWDAAELKIAEVGDDGRLQHARALLGGPGDPVAQAEWAVDGTLLAACERTGWWNLHRVDPETGAARILHRAAEEFAGSQRLGLRWFAPLADGRIAVLHGRGAQRLAVLDPADESLVDVPGGRTEWLPHLAVSGTRIAGVAAGRETSYEVVEVDAGAHAAGAAGQPTTDTAGHPTTLTAGQLTLRVAGHRHQVPVDASYLPEPIARVFKGPDGQEVHAHLYAPRHPDHTTGRSPDDGPAPYVVWAHGGPSLRAPLSPNLEIAYFTSRGIGVADVNYGGTPGYGREYRERLREQWGVVDVADCAAVARELIDEGVADRARLAIRGCSAGGFTAAASLITTDVYACATMLYPVLDLEVLAAGGSHDFESHYLESLIGPNSADSAARHRDRSPAAHPERITVPFLLLQGSDDPVCPPAQSRAFLAGASAVPHAYRLFEGEGHGFRRRDTMVAALEAELSFYGQVFGFTPPDVPVLELSTAGESR